MYGMSANDGRQRIGEFLEGIRGTRFDERGVVPATMSVGLAEYPNDAADLESLYRAADEALYVAKEEGRDRVVHCASRGSIGADVVLVERDAVLGRRVEQALQTRGYQTQWISTAAEAAAALAGDVPVPAPLMLVGGSPPSLAAGTLLDLINWAGTIVRCRVILLPRDAPEPMLAEALSAGEVERVAAPLDLANLMRLIRSS